MSGAPAPKPWIAAIAPYVPGRSTTDSGRPAVKLSANEHPFGPSPAALRAMREAIGKAHLYPDGGATALREAIAARFGLEPERIVCGAGSDDILLLLATAYSGPGDEVISVRYGFAIYPIAAERAGATHVETPDIGYGVDVDRLLAAVTPRTRIVYLANPNNPTGTVIGGRELERLHAGLPEDVLFVIDGAYAEFMDDPDYEDGLALARDRPNVVATRTFSKIYGLAAERVGWGYGPKPVMDVLNKVRAPFNVTTTGVAGAIAALGDRAYADEVRQHVIRWRAWLEGELAKLGNSGIGYVPSAANFTLATFPTEPPLTAEAAYHALMEDGYVVRWLPNQGLRHAIRITIGREEDMRGVVESLKRFVERAR